MTDQHQTATPSNPMDRIDCATDQRQIEGPQPDEIEGIIANIEAVRGKWRGDPAYTRMLDIELMALRMLRDQTADNVTW